MFFFFSLAFWACIRLLHLCRVPLFHSFCMLNKKHAHSHHALFLCLQGWLANANTLVLALGQHQYALSAVAYSYECLSRLMFTKLFQQKTRRICYFGYTSIALNLWSSAAAKWPSSILWVTTPPASRHQADSLATPFNLKIVSAALFPFLVCLECEKKFKNITKK